MGAEASWRPAATIHVLRLRARLLRKARRFFASRGVMEVDTPVLSACAASDVHIASLETKVTGFGPRPLYLQSSPESAMKRLLAAGSGPVFQFARAFRDGEDGSLHNPEFLLLEWYRPGFDAPALMDETEALVGELLDVVAPAERTTYRDAFKIFAGIDPFTATLEDLAGHCRELGFTASLDDRNAGLDLILSRRVAPALAPGRAFLFDFPADQAAMARLRPGDPPVAERFELFVNGIEIANGYRELADASEQRERIRRDLALRREKGLAEPPEDHYLLAALEHGLPDCAGVALGFDRLVAVKAGVDDVRNVMAFPLERA